MTNSNTLLDDVKEARKRYISKVSSLNEEQGNFQPSADAWSAAEITEHLVYAEFGGICGIYIALEKVKNGIPTWDEFNPNSGLTIEEIIDRTWKEKEIVPEPAAPRMGGSLAFWISALENNQHVLEKLHFQLKGFNPEEIIQPHPISGPMNVLQRYQFLRFHMDRHALQVERLKQHINFPSAKEKVRI